jgi:hypothetical protein
MSDKVLTAELIKKTALELGADLVGIGSMDSFEGAPPDRDPRFVFPEAKSIIAMGFRIHRGAFQDLRFTIEEWTH